VVRSTAIFTSAAAANPRSRDIQPGTYRLHEHMQASLAVALMLNPSSLVSYRVTIPEGYTAAAIVATIANKTPISAASLNAALADPSSLGLPAYANGHPEGFLFPATYNIAPGETATQALSAMVTRFDQAATQVKLAAGAKRIGLSEYAVITLASIVQREGELITDYPKIAEVFINRLHDDMPLQSDATEYYILGPNHGPLTASDLANPSPYNTRIHKGLPPTPINSPGDAAINAVLHHANGPLLYFVTIDKAGHTAFATTLDKFNQLVAESQANGVK
jgi:peptidoglycan lytic transglycosylase G